MSGIYCIFSIYSLIFAAVIIPEFFYNKKCYIIPAAKGGGDNIIFDFYTYIYVKEFTLIFNIIQNSLQSNQAFKRS
jgi:hypothetical protein